jgi:hypothetical protein
MMISIGDDRALQKRVNHCFFNNLADILSSLKYTIFPVEFTVLQREKQVDFELKKLVFSREELIGDILISLS